MKNERLLQLNFKEILSEAEKFQSGFVITEELEALIEHMNQAQLAKALQPRLDRPDREKALYETRVILWRYFREELTISLADDIAEEIYDRIRALFPSEEEIRREERERILRLLETFGINDRNYYGLWQTLKEEK